MEVYSQLNIKMKNGFLEAAMRRRKIDYIKDNRLNSTFWLNDSMAKKFYPGEKIFYGIKMTKKRRWGSEPGKVL